MAAAIRDHLPRLEDVGVQSGRLPFVRVRTILHLSAVLVCLGGCSDAPAPFATPMLDASPRVFFDGGGPPPSLWCEASSPNGFCYQGPLGSLLGFGEEDLAPPEVEIVQLVADAPSDLRFQVRGTDGSTRELVVGPKFGEALTIGLYVEAHAGTTRGPNEPRLDLHLEDRQFDRHFGAFEIRELEWREVGSTQVDRLVVDFELRPEGSTTPLTGQLRFASDRISDVRDAGPWLDGGTPEADAAATADGGPDA